MSRYFEKYHFVQNPYESTNPYKIDEKFLEWDRPDLADARKKLDQFLEDVSGGARVGMRIFGQTGSGKTWLTKIISKELVRRSHGSQNIIFIYTLIPAVEPSFSVMYREAISYFMKNNLKNIADFIKAKYGNGSTANWEKLIPNTELAKALYMISTNLREPELAKKWLFGERLSVSELDKLDITYALDGDYKRLTMLKELIAHLCKNFGPVVLVIDELENTPIRISNAIGDSLRALLDDFSENFALIASFTAEKEDEWYDIGFSEQLSRRFDYLVPLDSLGAEHVSEFLRVHHSLYLGESDTQRDKLLPFCDDALDGLFGLMGPEYHYPGFLLPNCGRLVREAAEKDLDHINSEFVARNKNILRYSNPRRNS